MEPGNGGPASGHRLALLGARLDFRECGPCGGACCTMPWTVFASKADLARLLAWLREAPEAASVAASLAEAAGKPREALGADDVATLAPLPEWERAAYGAGNLLYSRVADRSGAVPQLRKGPRGCLFLAANGRCGVHPAKPLLCRLFPFYYTTDNGRFERIVDVGHAGNCPITPGRMDEVASGATDALDELFRTFEREVQAHAQEKDAIAERWPRV